MEVSHFKNILWDYTRKISENTNIAFNPLCEKYGLTMLQVRLLVEIYHHDSHTIGGLASGINIAGANISTMCKKLESRGLLKRIRDQEDERVVKVVLTAKGIKIVTEIDKNLNDNISQYISGESEETLDKIIFGLEKLNELLQKIGKVEK